MRKKVAIFTIYSNNNFGNKLQNYAVQYYINKLDNFEIITIKNGFGLTYKKFQILRLVKFHLIQLLNLKNGIDNIGNDNIDRKNNFLNFDKKINSTKKYFSHFLNYKYRGFDYYIVGSDQVWHPLYGLDISGFLDFVDDNSKKISFSASFGMDYLPKENELLVKKYLSKFKAISVREDSGKNLVKKITKRNDCVVLVDPTMLLDSIEWDKVSKKPKEIDNLCKNNEKYILNYFLGKLSEERKKEIDRVAKENNCKIINILDKNDPFYVCGPSEFLWLEKNAFLICTDSFHSSVFAILYKRPFVVFNRDDGQSGINSMNSRIDTLLKKFNLENRYYKDKITDDLLKCNYLHVDKILEEERKKSEAFLKKALDIKE